MVDTFLSAPTEGTSQESPFLTFSGYEMATEDRDLIVQQTSKPLSFVLDKAPDVVAQEIANGGYSQLQSDATFKASETSTQDLSSAITQGDQEAINTAVANLLYEDSWLAPDVVAMLARNPSFGKTAIKTSERQMAALRIFEEKEKLATKGWLANVGYFADALFSDGILSPVGYISDDFEGANVLRDLAREASSLFNDDTISEEDFESRIREIYDQVADAGFFSEENPQYLQLFKTLMLEGGEGPSSVLASMVQEVDTLMTVGGLAHSAGKRAATGVARMMTKAASREAAVSAIVKDLEAGADTALSIEGTLPSMGRPLDGESTYLTGPELQARRESELNNSVLAQLKEAYGPLEFIDEDIIEAKRAEWMLEAQERNAAYRSHAVNYDVVEDDFGNLFSRAVLGNSRGKPYLTERSAQALADKIGGEVRTTLDEGKTKYIVIKDWNINTEGLAQTTDLAKIRTSVLSSIMSTTARTDPGLDARLKLGEGIVSKVIRDLGNDYRAAVRRVSSRELSNVNGIFDELLNDPNFNHRTTPYSLPEFRQRYEAKYNEIPSQSVEEYYLKAMELSDVDYYLNADILLKEAVNNGETMIQLDGAYYRARQVSGLPDDQLVYNTATNKYTKASDYDSPIYEVADYTYNPGGTGQVRYVAGEAYTQRRLYHSDVLGYNAGGHRRYAEKLNYFLKQESEITLGSGETVAKKPSTFMGVRIESEATSAVEQINNIIAAFTRGASRDETNSVIRANNSWNPDIEIAEDFESFFSDFNLDITKPVSYAEDGFPVAGDNFAGLKTYGERFRGSMASSKARRDRPLVGYGGHTLETLDPTVAVEQSFARSVARNADNAYLHNAINGWLKAAEGHIINKADLAGLPPRMRMENAKLGEQTRVARALRKERSTIQFRLNNTTADVQFMNRVARVAGDYAYGLAGRKGAKMFDWASTGNPLDFFRAMAFNLKLGLFAVDQLYVQASQLVNVVGIVGPVNGLKGVMTIMPLRLSLVDNIPEASIKRIASVQAPFTGISADEFMDLRKWIKDTGRNVVDQTIIDENSRRRFYDRFASRVVKAGQAPFREGETIARLGAAAANYLEMKAKDPNLDIFKPRVTREMVRRQDILTASMTSASAAPWQKSLLSMPLQFITYQVRMAEQIFAKDILTPAERVRLVASHLVMYGSSGVGLSQLLDKFVYENGEEAVPFNYELVRYGALDALIGLVSGGDTALSDRLAAGEGIADFFRDIFGGQESVPEFLLGPSGSIAHDAVTALVITGKNVYGGNFDSTSYDINRVAKNATSWSRATNFWYASRVGEYYNRKTGDILVSGLDNRDAVLLALGVPLQETTVPWDIIKFRQMEDENLKDLATSIKRLDAIGRDYIREQDWEGAARISNQIGELRAPLRPYEQERLDRYLLNDLTMAESLMQSALTTGKSYMQERLIELQENGN